MDFNDETVSSSGNGGTAHRGHVFAFSGTVARIYHHGKVAQGFKNRDRVNVNGVASGSLECADSAFTEDHARIVVAKYVLRSVKELLNSAHEAAFQRELVCGIRPPR